MQKTKSTALGTKMQKARITKDSSRRLKDLLLKKEEERERGGGGRFYMFGKALEGEREREKRELTGRR